MQPYLKSKSRWRRQPEPEMQPGLEESVQQMDALLDRALVTIKILLFVLAKGGLFLWGLCRFVILKPRLYRQIQPGVYEEVQDLRRTPPSRLF